jgi:ATP-binding cassette subfamily B protein
LLARWRQPVLRLRSGRVTLDGIDLRQLPDPVLLGEVVVITQENFLFEGSVADNIRLGRPGASDADVEAAAAIIGAHDFVAALPEGYAGRQTWRAPVGRAAPARLVRAGVPGRPAVLLLDEATSLLDIPSERLVQEALRTVLAGRTALIIAHRLSTVAIADRMLVLDRGRIAEDGRRASSWPATASTPRCRPAGRPASAGQLGWPMIASCGKPCLELGE